MRTHVFDDDAVTDADAVTLAATDPANPFGAALSWPARDTDSKHRPARKAGSLVVMHDGRLVLYLERGGKKALVFDDSRLAAAAESLASTVRARRVHRLSVESVDGESITDTPLGEALRAAGFERTPKGLRLDA